MFSFRSGRPVPTLPNFRFHPAVETLEGRIVPARFCPAPPADPPPAQSGGEVLSTDCIAVGAMTFHGKRVTVQLTNTTDQAVVLERLDLEWARANGKLDKVKLDGVPIHHRDLRPASASITEFRGQEWRRTLAPGETVNLVLVFRNKVRPIAAEYSVAAFCSCPVIPPPQGASLSGTVFGDVDRDGVFDPEESALGGVALTLTGTDDQGNEVLRTALTGEDGSYVFEDLQPGTYTISQDPSDIFQDGQALPGTLGGTPVGEEFSNAIANIVVELGQTGENYDFAEWVEGDSENF